MCQVHQATKQYNDTIRVYAARPKQKTRRPERGHRLRVSVAVTTQDFSRIIGLGCHEMAMVQNRFGIPFWLVGDFTHFRKPIFSGWIG